MRQRINQFRANLASTGITANGNIAEIYILVGSKSR